MVQRASGFQNRDEDFDMDQATYRKLLPILINRLPITGVSNIEIHDDWRKPIINHLTGLVEKPSQNLKLKSINYIMYSRIIFKRGSDGMLLECLSKLEGI